MSFRVRRMAALSLAVVAVMAGGVASAASASARPAHVTTYPEPDDSGVYPDSYHHHDRPLHVGPFDVPRQGAVSGGFRWDVRD
ncbi:hypothetical protein AB0C93_17105 [Streptomyces sp. NPDC048518]|uniref:hypothetical protein n=1 Tax=Streptomyces sp. NPDC048518 TaxID=3155029 RepID=UPI0033EC2AB8